MSLRAMVLRASVIGAVAASIVGATAAQAQAGIYTWKYSGSYNNASACAVAGADLVRTTEAVAYQCRGDFSTELYLAEIW
ncbi:hypothetical protein [Asanoa siamensis]|nr:hypothetical protein [Asanoa siamensis]